jgi:xylan 1,4-beta-xylosidase
VNFEGAVTWAFEFEGQPYFHGFRDLATNGIDKPVLNVFRMFGLMGGKRIRTESSGAVDLDAMVKSGIKDQPDINAIASVDGRKVSVLAWNYHDNDVAADDAPIELQINGVGANRVLVKHYRIDKNHSNAYALWQSMNSPQSPTPEQYAQLEAAGQLQLLASPFWQSNEDGSVRLGFPLPRQGVSLIQLTW